MFTSRIIVNALIEKILAVLVVVFLFLPISGFEGFSEKPAEPGDPEYATEQILKMVKFKPTNNLLKDFGGTLPLIAVFLGPIVFAFIRPKRMRVFVLVRIIRFLWVLALLGVVYVWVYVIFSPFILGHLFFISCALLLVFDFFNIFTYYLKKHNKYSQQDAAKNAAPLL